MSEEPVKVKLLFIVARFYDGITDELLRGATAAAKAAGYECDVVEVPGALEIPQIFAAACLGGHMGTVYAGAVALGCVIRGETTHYDTVANESARALMDLATRHGAALGNGILTVETEEQAWERARMDDLDKGGGAVRACLSVIAILEQLGARSGSFQTQPPGGL